VCQPSKEQHQPQIEIKSLFFDSSIQTLSGIFRRLIKKKKEIRGKEEAFFSFYQVSAAMCPMRFILVFFSAILAGYFAWTTVATSPSVTDDGDVSGESMADAKKQESNMLKMIQNGFWVFVDMASGRYLWRNIMEMKNQESLKSS
ncbi:hypothetical protein LINPERPRIM_LOCUS14317, partial [Linum perenne]